jgi:hypothetical protein
MFRTLTAMGVTALLLTALPAHAVKTVYRCQLEGQTVYADEPCPKGRGRAIKVDDSKSIVRRKDETANTLPSASGGVMAKKPAAQKKAARAASKAGKPTNKPSNKATTKAKV